MGWKPPKTVWNTATYANFLKACLEKLHIENPIVIGHSFGGKMAIHLAASTPVKKMILIDSAGIKPKRTYRYYFKVLPRKLAKKCIDCFFPKSFSKKIIEFFKKRMGSTDYKQASGIVREILIQSVNEDLRLFLPSILAPTLLIWGEKDKETPPSDGKLMAKLIPNSTFMILKNAGHFAYLDNFREFSAILDLFLKENTHD